MLPVCLALPAAASAWLPLQQPYQTAPACSTHPGVSRHLLKAAARDKKAQGTKLLADRLTQQLLLLLPQQAPSRVQPLLGIRRIRRGRQSRGQGARCTLLAGQQPSAAGLDSCISGRPMQRCLTLWELRC